MSTMTIDEAEQLIKSHTHWKHSFEIIPGVVTHGDWGFTNSAEQLDEIYQVPRDLIGLRALDIGALDGVHSFELERRGAQVTAIDIQSPDVTGFNIAKKIIGSKVEYIQGSVYDLTSLLKDKYDIVLFFGVWYHLKNPVRAFDEIAAVMNVEGNLYAEGEALFDYVEIGGLPATGEILDFVEKMGCSEIPISIYYPKKMKGDMWSWYVPNLACVNAWLQTCGLEMVAHSWWHDYPHQRLQITAKRDQSADSIVDNPVW
jgi:tRNA (mo5U34)-methyltransferase